MSGQTVGTIRRRLTAGGLMTAALLAVAAGVRADPIPYASLNEADAALHVSAPEGGRRLGPAPPPGTEATMIRDGVEAARSGDTPRASAIAAGVSDSVGRRLIEWAMVDAAGTRLPFSELDTDRRDLDGWPRASRREDVTETALETSGLPPQQTIDWFQGKDPETPEGAMALASAYQSLGRAGEAQALIRRFWREHVFEADDQARMLARFGGMLTQDDHAARLSLLLYGQQGPACRAMLGIVDADQRALGETRIALRADRPDAPQLVEQVPANLQFDPGLAFDRARYYRKRDLVAVALGLARNLPPIATSDPQITGFVWQERRALMNAALRTGDVQGAYAAASAHGLKSGADYTEAEFFAGWIALTKLHDPATADRHFANIEAAGTSPITVSRALYWRGRAAEARGDTAAAQGFWTRGAPYYTAFYGQLSAARIGQPTLSLGPDPSPTASDRARFEGRDLVRAARLLNDAGERDLFRTFVLTADDSFDNTTDYALLVDMARLDGDQDLSMRVVRAGAVKGYWLPERGYPIVQTSSEAGAAEPAFALAIARQESNFDPNARSGVGARGLMQLMPSTASGLARRLGASYSPGMLDEPTYNLRLGGYYLGKLVDDFGGSYVMAAAGYNAGPGRPTQWTTYCGDPRGGSTDPADFIECIPFSETRNYVMRVMETTEIYRARLNGGSTPLTLAEDLKRGSWTPGSSASPTGGPIPYDRLSGSAGPGRR